MTVDSDVHLILIGQLSETGENLKRVRAERLSATRFRIVDDKPEGERWTYDPGQTVECVLSMEHKGQFVAVRAVGNGMFYTLAAIAIFFFAIHSYIFGFSSFRGYIEDLPAESLRVRLYNFFFFEHGTAFLWIRGAYLFLVLALYRRQILSFLRSGLGWRTYIYLIIIAAFLLCAGALFVLR